MSHKNEEIKNWSIKMWAEGDRPREKLMLKGKSTLSDAELLAILIGSGYKEKSAVEVSKHILASAENNLNHLAKLSVNDLTKIKGIGEAKAITLIAALELGRRRKDESLPEKPTLSSSKDAYNIICSHLLDLSHEEFWVIYLNRANRLIKKSAIGKGGTSGTVADSKIIFKTAVELLASSVILCHNHPSGNLQPSREDKMLTQKIKEAGLLLDIQLLDHIIIAANTYFSFADEGIL
ncbi:MAG: DNA repair protein RadC [Bacteroidetes bacterium]|nr:JAB domain-containing protein [Bacteroidota bacterium]MCL4815133.1 DNA repair protein RadC [Flavobacteriales bacterium]NOG94475.1 DNA repair protein RadC [Bacteroidota bacterium]WKZ75567.1 MAG: DNA repair protein RadC [Vicingaceae bacterium]